MMCGEGEDSVSNRFRKKQTHAAQFKGVITMWLLVLDVFPQAYINNSLD